MDGGSANRPNRPARRGALIVLSGPSGAGKTTVYRRVLRLRSNLVFSVSCTTRAPRPGEIDGVHYHFVSAADFDCRVADGAFLEYAQVHGNAYGTLREPVERQLAAGRDVLLDIDVQGARQMRERIRGTAMAPAAVFVFLAPPSHAELARRLRGRGSEPAAVIRRRLHAACAEWRAWPEYDCLVINDELDPAVSLLLSIVDAAGAQTALYSAFDPGLPDEGDIPPHETPAGGG